MSSIAGVPLVSVLVPSYNSSEFLAECLESTLAQTHPAIEVIVVDDGSTDASFELARSFEPRGVRVIRQDNRGQAGALNTAFDASRGDYIQFLDADDVLHPGKIAAQLARLEAADPMAVASCAWARFQGAVADATFNPEPVWRDLAPVDWLVESWTGGGMMHVAGWLAPRRVVTAAGPWVEPLRWAANLDAHFFTRMLLASSICLFCGEARSYYRSGHPSMSSWMSRRSIEATARVVMENGEALLRKEESARTRSAYADNLQRFVYVTYPEGSDLVAQAERRIAELGGARLSPSGGSVFLALSKVTGWKLARRLRRLAGALTGR